MDKLAKVKAEVERLRKTNKVSEDKEYAQYELDVMCGYDMALDDILSFINSLPEEPVSEDLELTWEDIPKILSICENLKTSWWFRDNEQTKQIGTQVFWEEVLKRFKEQKEEQL